MSNHFDSPAAIPWEAMWPIMVVTATGLMAMIVEMIRPRKTNNAIVWTCLLGLGFAAFCVVRSWQLAPIEGFGYRFVGADTQVGGGLFIHDRFGQVMQLILIGVTFLTVLFSEGYLREKKIAFGEYYPLVLWSAVGGMIMATTRDLLIVFLGLETLSIALYVLAGLSNRERRSQESALKYFLLGAFASSFMLYGISLIYGATGTTHIAGIAGLFSAPTMDGVSERIAVIGIGLILIGFAFKAALVPFHMWTPDVYQGAPTTVTGFMAAGSKVAAFAALLRFLDGSIQLKETWLPILVVIGALTMTVGNLIALAQRDAKRILGYSSIAHAGYLIFAIVAWAESQGTDHPLSFNTVVYYLIGYGVMTIGAFAVLSLSGRKGKEGTLVEDYYGLFKRAAFPAAMMIIFMASLAGIPPTAGFFGKWAIFMDLQSQGLTALAILLAVNSVISVFYYLRLVMAVCVAEPELVENKFAKVNVGLWTACGLCGVGLLVIGVMYQQVVTWIGF